MPDVCGIAGKIPSTQPMRNDAFCLEIRTL